jgi:hypothetical protein
MDTAFNAQALISETYQRQQQEMHARYIYGTASKQYAPQVTEIINRLQVRRLLDYGCGKHVNLRRSIQPDHQLEYQGYDPAVPEMAGLPVPAEMVACIDVLEHVEPELLDNVLDHLAQLTESVIFLTVHTGPARKLLPDGRNAHLIQQPMAWWLPKLAERFDIETIQRTEAEMFHMIGQARKRSAGPAGPC